MTAYKAPLRDMEFVLRDLLDCDTHYDKLASAEKLSPDLLDAVLDSMSKFTEEVIAPLNQSGDAEGCHWTAEGVTTPEGFKEAYQQYVEGGWTSLSARPEMGGQGLPASLSIILDDMLGSANWAWSMYPGLSKGAARLLMEHGSPEQKKRYLTRLVDGSWTGTMCLTESHCGSDLGMLKTKAVANADGSYDITGTKIFISAGEHDLAENIVHLVIARVEGAPEGTKGISLFIVPKFQVNDDGSVGGPNNVSCGSIEHKMGIKASATAVMNFDGAKGYLVGEENEGLNYMFVMMNAARIGTAMQGMCAAESGLQASVEYARERLQMRSLTGPKNPDGPADPIIVHPDVRRMLLTQKAFAEGTRAFLYFLALQIDKDIYGNAQEQEEADVFLALLTPIAKAFTTETGLESANLALQCFGGHGYIKEHGVEQIVRDVRISTVYEGTTGIQALDLLGRKIMGSGGKTLQAFTKVVHKYCEANKANADIAEQVEVLARLNKEWGELTQLLGERAMKNADEVGAASVDYLMYSGYIVLAWFWAQMAEVAAKKLAAGEGDAAFYRAKIQTAQFYYARILAPRAAGHAAGIRAGAATLMDISEEGMYLG